MSFASAGNGTSDHLTAELFWQQTDTTAVHIPYKGGAPAMSDLLGGQVDATFMNINTGLPNIKAGKLARWRSPAQALAAPARRADDGRVGHQGRDRLLVAGVRRAEGPARATSRPSCTARWSRR
jgi:hypothetical protein